MIDRWVRIGKAAKILGVSPKTLIRAERRGAIRFSRNRRGWRIIQVSQLKCASVVTLGRMAKRLNLRYKILLTATGRYQLHCSRPYRRHTKWHGYRRVSLTESHRFKRWVYYRRALRRKKGR